MMMRMLRSCAFVTSSRNSSIVPNSGSTARVVGDVVAAVAQRRLEERRKPERVDAEPLQVVELADQPAEVAGAVAVAVDERPHHDLVEDRSCGTTAGRESRPGSWMGAVKVTRLLGSSHRV